MDYWRMDVCPRLLIKFLTGVLSVAHGLTRRCALYANTPRALWRLCEIDVVDCCQCRYDGCKNGGFYEASRDFLHHDECHYHCHEAEYVISEIFHFLLFMMFGLAL